MRQETGTRLHALPLGRHAAGQMPKERRDRLIGVGKTSLPCELPIRRAVPALASRPPPARARPRFPCLCGRGSSARQGRTLSCFHEQPCRASAWHRSGSGGMGLAAASRRVLPERPSCWLKPSSLQGWLRIHSSCHAACTRRIIALTQSPLSCCSHGSQRKSPARQARVRTYCKPSSRHQALSRASFCKNHG